MCRTVRVFLNPKSGSANGVAGQVKQLFSDAGCVCTVHRVKRGLDLAAALRPGDIAVAGGGDGTVNAVAQAVAKTANTMGVLPSGTLNHFAQDLHIPLHIPDAIQIIATGEPRSVDAAEVNGIIFVNNSSLGAYPAMVLDRERLKRVGWNKWPSLVFASLRAFIRFRCLAVDISLNGQIHHHTTPFLFVGNNEYCMDGIQLGTRASLTGGKLYLYLAPGASRFGILRLGLAALAGRLHAEPQFQQFSTCEFTVHVPSSLRLRVAFDGEVRRMQGPLHYRMLPRALEVIQPPAAVG